MTDLLIDLGNTRIKWAQSASGCWLPGAALYRGREFAAVLDEAWAELAAPARVVLASVASPADTGVLEWWVHERWGLRARRVHAGAEQFGVVNRYREPSTLGVDRWAGLVAARGLEQRACAVVDCGTAVTIDVLSADGVFVGGVILPGLRLSRQSLGDGTAHVRAAAGDDASCLALATADAVAAGTAFGLVGSIDRVLQEQERALDVQLEVFITGGDAPLLMTRLAHPVIEVPDLILKGLARIAEELT